jgi:hypothetical protein
LLGARRIASPFYFWCPALPYRYRLASHVIIGKGARFFLEKKRNRTAKVAQTQYNTTFARLGTF